MYRHVEESQTLLINTQSQNLRKQNKRIIQFGFGQSPFLPPENVREALQSAVHHKEYTSVQGDYELRELLAAFHKDHNQLAVLPENILIAPGSKILLFSILMAFEKADVFIPAPAWVSYGPQAKLLGHHIIKLPTDFEQRWRVDGDILKEASKQKIHKASILILNYPGNPDGLTYTEDEIMNIAEEARRQNMLVISDEIYALLDHKGTHKSFHTFYPERTITTTGLSKWCGAGGWRFGAALLYEDIEPEFKQALIGIGSETYSCAPAPVQMAAKVAYSSFQSVSPYLRWQTNILEEIGQFCAEQLNLAKISVHAPQGGFYLFPNFSFYQEQLAKANIFTSNELCERLLAETGVTLLPASAFGFDKDFLCARLAYVDFSPPIEYGDFNLKTDAPNIVEGIEAIAQWIKRI